MDEIKSELAKEVAYAVQQHIRGYLTDGSEVSTSFISRLETQIRVKQRTGGIRYFTVKVSENF